VAAKVTATVVDGFIMFGYLPAFWALPQRFPRAPELSGGIATINAIANIAGFTGPDLMGYLYQETGSYRIGLLVLAATGAALSLLLRTVSTRPGDVWGRQAARAR